MPALLTVDQLRLEITSKSGTVPVIDNLSFSLNPGETVSLVGESGCGKSMTALAIMGLLPDRIARITKGGIFFNGEDLTRISQKRAGEIRGNEISMIFQEPMTSLNPVYTIGEQIAEVLRRHQNISSREGKTKAIELLAAVRLPNPDIRINYYPHQLSGGQRQRVMIAIALACRPKILIADEPTTALDVTVQAQIFDLMRELTNTSGTAIIFITHDMGAVTEMSERMIVMYAGRKAEAGQVQQIIDRPRHPYTKGLIACVPHLLAQLTNERPQLAEIDGIVPSLNHFGRDECLFAARCNLVKPQCRRQRPQEITFNNNHVSACWRAEEL